MQEPYSSNNNPFNYYALFVDDSKKRETFYEKYFLRITDDYTKEKNQGGNKGFWAKLSDIFNPSGSESQIKLSSDGIEFNANFEDNKFMIDKVIDYEKSKRLNEKDNIYKVKKHYQNNLNEHYKQITTEERKALQAEWEKENEYLRICTAAEMKLKLNNGANMSIKELNYLIRRNFPLFTNEQKSDINKLNNLYYSLLFANLLGVTIITSFCKSVFSYFQLMSNRTIIRTLFLTSYFSLTITNNTLYLNDYINKKLIYYPLKIKHVILNKDNEKCKVPYDQNMYTYKPEEKKKMLIDF